MGSQEQGRSTAARCVPLFAGLDQPDLDAIARISDEVTFPAGEELIRENEQGRQFFVLLEGEAEVRRGGVEINRLGPGDFFGEISLLSARPTTATVETTTSARALLITPGDFRRLLEDVPLLQWKVIEALLTPSRRVRRQA